MSGGRRPRVGVPSDGGAALVEGVLVLPIIVLLVFGVIEWGLYMRDTLSVTEAARVGARTASALPRETGFTQTTADAIGRAGSAIPKSQFSFVLVYKANDKGYPGPNGNTTMNCSVGDSTCDKFVWNGTSFVPTAGITWDASTVNACPTAAVGGPPDSVGVYVQATHRWLTGLFGTSKTVGDRAVLRFEPKPARNCR